MLKITPLPVHMDILYNYCLDLQRKLKMYLKLFLKFFKLYIEKPWILQYQHLDTGAERGNWFTQFDTRIY